MITFICPECKGEGKYKTAQGSEFQCENCKGSGRVITKLIAAGYREVYSIIDNELTLPADSLEDLRRK